MALSSIHDAANPDHKSDANVLTNGCNVERSHETDKQFRPNPDAKPFIPNSLTVAARKWQIYFNENSKNVNGITSPFLMAPHIDRENALAEGQTSNPTKKHIAFHLVSNVLDDEVPEESVKDSITTSLQNNPHLDVYGSMMSNQVDSWQTPSSKFSLPLSTNKSLDERSINNKSIHEIWSPGPSPDGLNDLSPNDEVLNTYQTQQLHNGHGSITDSPEFSFEQVQNEKSSATFTTGLEMSSLTSTAAHVQNYGQLEENNEEDSQNPYVYQDVQSPEYNTHYDYRNITHCPEVPVDTYQAMLMRKDKVPISNDANSILVEQNDYYATYCVDRYQGGGDCGYQVRNKYEQPVQMSYDLQMSFMEELRISLDECCDQLKHLERDSHKANETLIQEFCVRVSCGSDSGSLKHPANSTRVDELVIDQQKEHLKVESLIGRIERLGFTPMHPNVGVSLDLWLTGIKELQNVHRNGLIDLSEIPHLHNGSESQFQEDICSLIARVKELTKHTRSARTIVWCALQMLYASMPSGISSGE